MKLTQDRLKGLLDYDPETGVFIWKVDRGKRTKKGSFAGSLDNKGYLIIRFNGKGYKAHRLAFLYMEGYFPENQVDHIDRDKTNNKWNNLREVSHTCNMRNCKISKINTSGITGVSWHKGRKKWQSQIRIPKPIYLGLFDNLIDAAKARWEAEVKYNFPNCNTTSAAYVYLKEKGAI